MSIQQSKLHLKWEALNWMLSGIVIKTPCQVDLVIFFPRFPIFSPPCFHFSALFILLPCLSHFLSFHHCLISHSQSLLTPSLSPRFSLNNYFHTLLWHDRGACKWRVWQMQMSVWQGVVQHCSPSHYPPTYRFVMYFAFIALCESILTCWHEPERPSFMVYLWMKLPYWGVPYKYVW